MRDRARLVLELRRMTASQKTIREFALESLWLIVDKICRWSRYNVVTKTSETSLRILHSLQREKFTRHFSHRLSSRVKFDSISRSLVNFNSLGRDPSEKLYFFLLNSWNIIRPTIRENPREPRTWSRTNLGTGETELARDGLRAAGNFSSLPLLRPLDYVVFCSRFHSVFQELFSSRRLCFSATV